jgi:hypothetical protein
MLAAIILLILFVLAGALLWRRLDERAAAAAWAALAAAPSGAPERFDPSSVSDLPEPARRFFGYAILPGAPLGAVAEIEMTGELGLGTKEAPGYRPMRARQILSAPHGLVWKVEAGSGPMRISGSDGMVGDRSWTRFWLAGLVPVVRAGGSRDHLRAAFGRVVAETAFWAPAALLPQNGVSWEAVDENTARATVNHRGLTQTVDVRVDAEGRPLWVTISRWTDANPEKVFRLQPFGGSLSDFREVGGFRLPFHVEGGNFFGTMDYFPFYRAAVQEIQIRPFVNGDG